MKRGALLKTWLAGVLLASSCVAQAGITDLADVPLATTLPPIPPNLMFILDNSGSMDWDFLGDYVDNSDTCKRALTGASYREMSFASRSGSVITYYDSGHGLSAGDMVQIRGATGGSAALYNGWFAVTWASGDYFRVDLGVTPSADPGGSLEHTRRSFSHSDACTMGQPPWYASSFNAIFYNPAQTYEPGWDPDPSTETGGIRRANQTNFNSVRNDGYLSAGTTNLVTGFPESVFCLYADDSASSSNCVRNGVAGAGYSYPDNALGSAVSSTTPVNHYGTYSMATSANPRPGTYPFRRTLYGLPHYYVIQPLEFCSSARLENCSAATVPTGTYVVPAPVRYCKTAADAWAAPGVTGVSGTPASARCTAKWSSTYKYVRYGRYIRVDVTPGGAWTSLNRYCRDSTQADCVLATSAPSGYTLAMTYGNMVVGGYTLIDRSNRYDCLLAPNCTATEEMINFSNWWAYYRKRMQMMKTTVGKAFLQVDKKFRVGFVTINNSSSNFLALSEFTPTQRGAWYPEFYSQNPGGGTPLLPALSLVGRHFAGRADGINTGIGAADSSDPRFLRPSSDPVVSACQRNFAVLTTDGYWNSGGGYDIDNTSSGVYNTDNLDSGDSKRADGAFDGGGTAAPGTLADVAMYYYKTDLRNGGNTKRTGYDPSKSLSDAPDVSPNTLVATSADPKASQHMNVYGIGLADGLMLYKPGYDTATDDAVFPNDFSKIKNGRPLSECPWPGIGSSSVCNWPVPAADAPSALDDLWHASVNARGKFYHAVDSASLTAGINGVLKDASARTGAASAAATSNPVLSAGTDNFVYSSTYRSGHWDGELMKKKIDATTGAIDTSDTGTVWKAQSLLDAKVGDSTDTRTILTFDGGAASGTKAFNYGALSTTEKTWFDNKATGMPQYSALIPADKATANAGTALISYLRGQRQYEGTLYRAREHVLGDAVNAPPLYVGASWYEFSEDGFPAYKALTASRTPVVYQGANDGMLHAFNAETGQEMWAYVPRMAMPDLWQLARNDYSDAHRMFVDGPLTVMDVYDGSNWHTVLVVGMGKGGRGYFALDVTDPASPKALWEICNDSTRCAVSDPDLGYSYGNPVITKRKSDLKWVVYFTSGMNNVSPGNGHGILYQVDVLAGTILQKIDTGAGSSTTPTGLNRIAVYADMAVENNLGLTAYGGDLFGNFWRFALDRSDGAITVSKLAELKDASGVPQPVTTAPETSLCASGTKRVIFVGTGRMLGQTDLDAPGAIPSSSPYYPGSWSDRNTIYAVHDDLTEAPLGNLRAVTGMQNVTMVTTTSGTDTIRKVTSGAVDFATDKGWVLDLTEPRERIIQDPMIAGKTNLTFISSIPDTAGSSSSTKCEPTGQSFDNQIDKCTATALKGVADGRVSTLYNAFFVGTTLVKTASGELKRVATKASGGEITLPTVTPLDDAKPRRGGWHELFSD